MIRKIYIIITLFISSFTVSMAQTSAIQGRILDSATKEGIPFANVVAEIAGSQAGGAQTDMDGNFAIKPLSPGNYDLKVSYVGYQSREITGIEVTLDRITSRDIYLSSKIVTIGTFVLAVDQIPVFEKDNVTTGGALGSKDIHEMGIRDINSVAATIAGVYQDGSGAIEIRGARSDATKYVVDGIPVIGSAGISKDGIEQISVYTGGIPASVGDVAGGVINITTKGASKEYSGGVELLTSELLDSYGYNLVSFNLSGPLLMKTDSKSKDKRPLAGFFIVGEYEGAKDASPSAIGTYQANSSTLTYLNSNPIRPQTQGQGFNLNSDYITADDITHLKYKDNAATGTFRLSGKVDFKPSVNTDFTVGGSLEHTKQHNWIYEYSLLNPSNNPVETDNTYRAFARFTQKFNNDTSSKNIIKNAFYSIQFDYSKNSQTVQSDQYQNNLFDYGYVGKFTTYKGKTYGYGTDATTGLTGWLFSGYQDTLVTFQSSPINQFSSNYAEQYYDLSGANVANQVFEGPGANVSNYNTLATIQANGGLINGQRANNVYGLWYNTGRVYNGNSFFNNDQYRVSASGSADVGKHAITIGFEYEQRINRSWSVAPIALWTIMRQYANQHLTQLDVAHPIKVVDANGVFQDTINYNRLYNASQQANFDKNLRTALGMPINGTNWIDIDSYAPSTFSLNMFDADELLNNGLVGYYGYDYLGNSLTSTPSFDDYFTQKDSKGNFTRAKAAFEPIYTAGYIQDKFSFNDIIFNIGLRIDRYDANQKVLKDPYSIYPTHTAGDSYTATLLNHTSPPSNIGSNYVVYVNDLHSPTSVVGYRDPSSNNWYDSQGNLLNDPSILAKATSSGTIAPYLINSNDDITSSSFVPENSFTNYVPQISVMPRIAFSFPISDEALFFAHYDVLTQRPTTGDQMDPTSYYFIQQESGALLNNPNLQPERTTDYELGFKQKLNRSSSFTLSGFYRELRNNIEVANVLEAYPVTYKTFQNLDFGTVKGLTLSYDLRRTSNVRLTASYTLQFANGTGSAATSGYAIINSGEPNIVVPMPLSFDQRHTIVTSIDYRFGSGIGDDKYDGPILFGKKILKSTGFNFIFHAGSGTPYTAQSNITELGAFDQNLRSVLSGSINGSRLPWQFRIDAKIDKDITIKSGKKQGEDRKLLFLNIYLQINNLLNAQNIISVYATTGNPNDDGFLAAAQWQTYIAQQISTQAFIDQYKIKINNPGNYSLPRVIRLGASLNF